MKPKTINQIITSMFIFLISLSFASALVVDADYITIYPGEQGKVAIDIENNEDFDIEDVSVSLILDEIPFSSVGSSEKSIDEIDEDDDDKVSFTIKASTDIKPGDYDIPYKIKYVNADDEDDDFKKEGSFGLRVSAKTELDFTAEVRENAIVGQEGKISLEIINKGLGDIKSVSVQIFPQGFELLSKDKIFIGTINADDTDLASFDVIYKGKNPVLSARIDYKDFDNNDKTQTVNLPVKVYSTEEALELGLINQSRTGIYAGVVAGLIIVWFVYRKIKKRRKNNKGK